MLRPVKPKIYCTAKNNIYLAIEGVPKKLKGKVDKCWSGEIDVNIYKENKYWCVEMLDFEYETGETIRIGGFSTRESAKNAAKALYAMYLVGIYSIE